MGKNSTLAVSKEMAEEYGCPNCGCSYADLSVSTDDSTLLRCGDCQEYYFTLQNGVKKPSMKLNGCQPGLSLHPRVGIPSHAGEYFSSRGMGLDFCKCFVCKIEDRDGKGHPALNNIAAFVKSKEAGEKVLAMFTLADSVARLDYRPSEPNWIQVKVGACDAHRPNLEMLEYLVTPNRCITVERIKRAVKS